MSDNDGFSAFMKQLNQKAGGDMGLDNELEQMEKEFGIENKGNNEDDELAKLEQEDDDENLDLDNIDGDENDDGNDDEEKLQKQNELKQSTKNSKQTEDNKDDIYLEDTEEKYHNPKNIKSVSAIDDEKNICDKIIAFKKKLKLDFDYWETKKTLLNQQEEFMTSCIESGTMSVEKYKNLIKKCQDIDKQFLKEIPNDKNLQAKELKELQKRIEKRINITQSELDTEIDEEEGEEEEVEKEEPQSQPQQQQQPKQQQQLKQQQQQPRQIKEETNSYQQNSLVIQSQFKELAQNAQLSAKEFSLIIDIEQRLKEYQSALAYFQENNIETNKKDANTKVKIIKAILVAMKIGEGQGITMEDMPPKVTPEYICGYSMAERETKFKKVLQYLVTEIKKLKEEKNHINQNKKEPNTKLTEIENKIQLKEKEFKELLQFQKDEWIPCPEFGIVEKNIVTEVINEYVKDESMVLHISNFSLQIDDFYIEIVLPLETPKKETIFPVKSNIFANDVEWVFTEKEFKSLHKKNIDFKIFKKKVFRSKLYFEFSVKLKPFQNKSIIKEEIKLKNDKKNLSETISVTAVIRQPLLTPEKTKQVLKEFSIKKKYKKFEITIQNDEFSLSQSNLNIKVNTNHQNNSPPKPSNQPKPSIQAKPSAQPKPSIQAKPSAQPKPSIQAKPSAQPKPSIQAKPSAQPKPPNQTKQQVVPNPKQPIDKSKFSATELKNPESLEFIVSVQVLEYRVTQLQKKMSSFEGRIPKELKELFIKTKSKLTQFKNALGDQITPIQYKELLTNKINHDQMLCAYFTSIGEQKKADFVQKKVDIMNSEIKELNEMLEQE